MYHIEQIGVRKELPKGKVELHAEQKFSMFGRNSSFSRSYQRTAVFCHIQFALIV